MKEQIQTDTVGSAPKILSQAIEADGFIFISGQIGADAEWKLVEGGIEEETKQAMENIKKLLEATELDFENVVKVTIYTTIKLGDSKKINDIYIAYFQDPLPAREMIGVRELPLGAKIEISVVAAK